MPLLSGSKLAPFLVGALALFDFTLGATKPAKPDPCSGMQTINPAVVLVETLILDHESETMSWYQIKRCTGVIVGPSQVLTARHCLETGAKTRVWINYMDNPVLFYTPDETGADLALLEVMNATTISAPTVVVEPATNDLILIGFGHSKSTMVLNPEARKAKLAWDGEKKIGVQGCICHGDSGGPVLDKDGNLLAVMHTTKDDGKHGTAIKVWDFLYREGLIF